LCVISVAIAIISKPTLIITRLWPYIVLLISFANFVFWNGGVVLGTSPSPQYSFLSSLMRRKGDKSNHVATIHLPQMLYIWPFIAFFSAPLILPPAISFTLSLFTSSRPSKPIWKYLLTATYALVTLAVTLVIVKYNTIIHPFTLADNRHYIFYVFRYSILRHPLIRYLLGPVYLICAYLVYLTLSRPSPSSPSPSPAKKDTRPKKIQPEQADSGPTTSFVFILLATTALSLVTAPLVEPRYFIIPWVIWRLHVPSTKGKSYDWRLWAETAWFLVINAVTGYVFLYRGFEWVQEVGRVQRFMW
jgi:alpha-1,2-glucosyltransferase